MSKCSRVLVLILHQVVFLGRSCHLLCWDSTSDRQDVFSLRGFKRGGLPKFQFNITKVSNRHTYIYIYFWGGD